MKAKLFKFLPIELKASNNNPDEFQLLKPIEIKAKDFLGNLNLKLPTFIQNLLTKKITIKSIIWSPSIRDKQKPKSTMIETEINLQPLFKKVEKYVELNEAKLIVSTDIQVVSVVE